MVPKRELGIQKMRRLLAPQAKFRVGPKMTEAAGEGDIIKIAILLCFATLAASCFLLIFQSRKRFRNIKEYINITLRRKKKTVSASREEETIDFFSRLRSSTFRILFHILRPFKSSKRRARRSFFRSVISNGKFLGKSSDRQRDTCG